MSLNVMLTLEDIVEQIGKYEKQLVDTTNAVQQIKGAIAACKHQMTLLVQKQNEHVLKQAAEGVQQDAIEEGKQPESDLSEHQNGDCSGETTETSGSNCAEQSQQEQQQEEQVA